MIEFCGVFSLLLFLAFGVCGLLVFLLFGCCGLTGVESVWYSILYKVVR